MDIMPTLRAERQATYSPILPISQKSGIVLQVPVEVIDADAGFVRFVDASDGMGDEIVEQSVLSGGAKLQWKVDWAMRWVALGVDYEMYGKDLTDSGVQSGRIATVLGGRKPEGLIYELFLDDKGEKISKSKGNGLSIDDWLTYGPDESLAFYIYREPKKAKSLHPGLIPRAVDDYWQFRAISGQPSRNPETRSAPTARRRRTLPVGAPQPGRGDGRRRDQAGHRVSRHGHPRRRRSGARHEN